MNSPRPTLDGQAFLAEEAPQTWFLVRALQGVAEPGDAVAEAAGMSYNRFTRIAMHTGQPTVVGWEWHLKQRGQSQVEINARFADLEMLYAGVNPDGAKGGARPIRRGLGGARRISNGRRYGLSDARPARRCSGPASICRARRCGPLPGAAPRLPRCERRSKAALDLPAGIEVVGKVPERSADVIRSLALDESGATVILRDGSVVDLDVVGPGAGGPRSAAVPPDDIGGAAARGEVDACDDGSLWVRQQGWKTLDERGQDRRSRASDRRRRGLGPGATRVCGSTGGGLGGTRVFSDPSVLRPHGARGLRGATAARSGSVAAVRRSRSTATSRTSAPWHGRGRFSGRSTRPASTRARRRLAVASRV